jgi:cysteine synthase B
MIAEAVVSGTIGKRTVLDSSSGNAGIAYAMIGMVLGLPVELVVPGNASLERKKRILAHGARLVHTDPLEGYDEALREAHRRAEQQPESTSSAISTRTPATGARITTGPPRKSSRERMDGSRISWPAWAREARSRVSGGTSNSAAQVWSCARRSSTGGGLKPLGHPGDIVRNLDGPSSTAGSSRAKRRAVTQALAKRPVRGAVLRRVSRGVRRAAAEVGGDHRDGLLSFGSGICRRPGGSGSAHVASPSGHAGS